MGTRPDQRQTRIGERGAEDAPQSSHGAFGIAERQHHRVTDRLDEHARGAERCIGQLTKPQQRCDGLFVAMPPGQEGEIPAGDWAQDQIDTMLDMIDEAETVLPAIYPMVATYADLSATLGAMGYHDFGINAPGGYAHWINNDLLDGDTLDPAHVESLVYQYDFTDSTYRLVSAMYMLGSEYDATSVPAEIAWPPGWHAHADLCATPDLRFDGFAPCSGSSMPLSNYPMMHVWIVNNPCDHRFGGVDQGGLRCAMAHHDPSDHDPDGHDPDSHDPGGHDPGSHDPGDYVPGDHEPGAQVPTDVGTSNAAGPSAVPAAAVTATPTFTG